MRSVFWFIGDLEDNYSFYAMISLDQNGSVKEGITHTLE